MALSQLGTTYKRYMIIIKNGESRRATAEAEGGRRSKVPSILSSPRYFCKACKRYWTIGGTLRNVPVGGGSRARRLNHPNTTPSPSSDQQQQ
ncbi:hypothetical protein AHAS_Ahas20G0060600 [Arachis hypogaea]